MRNWLGLTSVQKEPAVALVVGALTVGTVAAVGGAFVGTTVGAAGGTAVGTAVGAGAGVGLAQADNASNNINVNSIHFRNILHLLRYEK